MRLQVCLLSLLSLGALALGALNGAPGTAQTDTAILARALAVNTQVSDSLQSFVCNETINRFSASLDGAPPQPIDTVTAKLSYERGIEQYSDILQDNRRKADMTKLTGAWSEGEFGTLLRQTRQLLADPHVEFDGFAQVGAEEAAVYRLAVSEEESPWELIVAGHQYDVPFNTKIWVSVKSGEMLKIDRTTVSLAPETRISAIEWGITLSRVSLNGKTYLLPSDGTYTVLYNGSRRRLLNYIHFANYQRYGAQTAVEFN